LKKLVITSGLILFICVVAILLVDRNKPNFIRDDTLILLESNIQYGDFDIIEENRMVCDLVTVSNIILNMQKDGYAMEQLSDSREYLDFALSKDSEVHRIHYNLTGEFTSICNQYEKSYLPITYITVKDITERKK